MFIGEMIVVVLGILVVCLIQGKMEEESIREVEQEKERQKRVEDEYAKSDAKYDEE